MRQRRLEPCVGKLTSPVLRGREASNGFLLPDAFIKGQKLSETIRHRPLEPRKAAQIVKALAGALAYAHSEGIVHRDVKPDNIMLDDDGEPHLIDFGLARIQDSVISEEDADAAEQSNTDARKTRIAGTLVYMSPEAAMGQAYKAQPAMDQYSLGVTLYELLCGKTPFHRGAPAIILSHVIKTPPPPLHETNPNVKVPPDLEEVCRKPLAKNPGDRYPTCQLFAEDLDRWLNDESVSVRLPSMGERFWRWCRKEPKLALTATAAAVLLLILTITMSVNARNERLLRRQADDAKYEAQENAKRSLKLKIKAEKAQRRADKEVIKKEQAKNEAIKGQAELLFDRALNLCKQGEIAQGMVYFTRGLTLAEGNPGFNEMADVLRTNLTGWGQRMHHLTGVYDYDAYRYRFRAAGYVDEVHFIAAGEKGARGVLCLGNAKGEFEEIYSHEKPFVTMVCDRKARKLLAGCEDGNVYLFEWTNTARQIQLLLRLKLPEQPKILSVALSPTAKQCLIGCANGKAYLWNTLRGSVQPKQFDLGAGCTANTVAFSWDEQWILVGGGKQHGGVFQLWDAGSLDKAPKKVELPRAVQTAAFCPHVDHKNLFVIGSGAEFEGQIQFWEIDLEGTLPVAKQKGSPQRHQAAVYVVAFNEQGTLLLTGSQDRAARVWHVESQMAIGQPLRHSRDVRIVLFSPDDKSILSGGDENAFRRWNLAGNPVAIRHFEAPGIVLSAAAIPQKHMVIAGGVAGLLKRTGHVWRWQLPPSANSKPDVFQPSKFPVFAVAASADGEWIACGCGDYAQRGELVIWNTTTIPRSTKVHKTTSSIQSVALSPSGRLVAVGCIDGSIHVWNLQTGTKLKVMRNENVLPQRSVHKPILYALAFSPDGQLLLSGGRDGFVRLWKFSLNAVNEMSKQQLNHAVTSIAFSGDGKMVLTGYAGGVRLWDCDGNKLTPHGNALFVEAGVMGVAFRDDNKQFLTCGTNGFTWLWDTKTMKPVGPPWRRFGPTFQAGFLDKKRIYTAGSVFTSAIPSGSVEIWRTPAPIQSSVSVSTIERWVHRVTGIKWEANTAAVIDPREWKAGQKDIAMPNIQLEGVPTFRGLPPQPSFLVVPLKSPLRFAPEKSNGAAGKNFDSNLKQNLVGKWRLTQPKDFAAQFKMTITFSENSRATLDANGKVTAANYEVSGKAINIYTDKRKKVKLLTVVSMSKKEMVVRMSMLGGQEMTFQRVKE